MRDNDRKPTDSRTTESEHPQREARQPAPGKVTRTSKLTGRSGPAVQRQARAAGLPAPRSQARTAWEHTQDPWMDAAHRGLSAFAGQAPVQAHGNVEHEDPASVHRAAADGIRTNGSPLPHAARIQQSFGPAHELGGVRAHVGGAAAEASERMGADAYATGEDIAFRDQPDLHTAAHEAAHVVQQRSGVALAGGVGRAGDAYEQHADAVADRVVQGKSAADILDQMSGAAGGAPATGRPGGVQHQRRTAVQRADGAGGETSAQPAKRARSGSDGSETQAPQDKRARTEQTGQVTDAQAGSTPTPASAITFQGQVDRVEWTGSHAMTAFGGDARVNPVWTPGTVTHAAAYTQGAAPALSVHVGLGEEPPTPLIRTNVRAKLGGAVVAEGTANVSGDALDATGLATHDLPDADRLTRALYSLSWEASVDGQTWSPLGTSGEHRVYWLVGTPQGTLYSLAADKVTQFGANDGDPATAIRMGIHGAIPYDPTDGTIEANPLTMFSGGGHVCADFANLLTALGRAAGLASNPLIYFGGLTAAGKMLWVRESTTGNTLARVQPGDHSFTYHAIASVGGAIHDAALNRAGIDARATMQGVRLKAADLSAASVPAGKVGQAYDRVIDRTAQAVAVQQYRFGGLLDIGSFGLVVPLDLPPGSSGVVEVGGAWSVTAGALPPGLALEPGTGRLSGTPTAAGAYTFTVQIDLGAGITGAAAITVRVDP